MPARAGCFLLFVLLAAGCGRNLADQASDSVARWALGLGGKVSLAGSSREFERVDQLPTPPYAIERLILNNTKVDDDDLARHNLSELSRLKYLGLHSTGVTNAGLETILKIGTLTDLELSNTQVTDEGLAMLGEMRQLRVLFLYNDAVSADAIARLQQRLPDCKIYH
jgi:hypothetical protein